MMRKKPAKKCGRILLLISAATALALSAAAQHSPPAPASGHAQDMKHDQGPDMQTIHRMFARSDTFKRTAKKLPDGVETLTESSDPAVTALLQEHVRAMQTRLKKRQPIRAWDPLFAELFTHADKIALEIQETKQGVRIIETSRDPSTVKLLQAHANAVSDFIREGMAGMAKRHDIPGEAVSGRSKYLGKGDGIATCPVTGEPVNKNIKAVIQGRLIYFCCDSCVAVVKKQPELYLKTVH